VTPFILICAAMLVAAIAYLAVPLVRRVPSTAKGAPAVPRSTAALVATVVVLPLAAVALYSKISNFPWDSPIAAAAVPAGHGEGGAGDMKEITAQLEARLAENPSDVEGWQMLGRTYLVTGDAVKAAAAYQKAIDLTGGNDAALKLDLAEALILTQDPAVQEQASQIVEAAVTADSSNGKALWYSGVIANRTGDKETAKARWKKMLELGPPDEIRQIVVEQFPELGGEAPAMAAASPPSMGAAAGGAATGAMGGAAAPGATTSGAAEGPAPTGRTIRIAISVDPKIAGKLQPGTPLFVAARQPGIPGPPLAAVRVSSDQLPTTVVLSDANAMMEGRNLSSVDDVEVVARVAFGGTAVTATGDLIGKVSQKKGGSTDVSIVIDQVAP
jgi:cytochrome c-type biogenesis protein CcmH